MIKLLGAAIMSLTRNTLWVSSYILILGIIFITLNSFIKFDQPDWDVPEHYEKMTNPIEGFSEGKTLFTIHCKSCHGKYGEGDGPKAANLDTNCGDFTDEDFQSQTDGALFYKTSEGRDDMPAFSKKLDDTEIWSIINYVRTL